MRLSIIIPMFNSQKTIRRAIKSCLVGDSSNIEIILVDDGSTDSTVKVVKETFKKEIDSGIIKIINSDHGGAGNARNIGIQISVGKWIIFLDSDDEFVNFDYIKADVAQVDESITILNYTSNPVRNRKQVVYGRDYIFDNLGLSNDTKKNWDSGPVFKCYRRKFLIKNKINFPLDIKIGEDLIFNLQCLLLNSKILTKKRYMYRIHEEKDSITHKIISKYIISDAVNLVQRVLQFNIKNKLKQEFIAKNFIAVLIRFLKSKADIAVIINSLIKYKRILPLKKSFMSFLELYNSLNIYKVLIAWIIWIDPNILRVILYKTKR